MSDAVQLMKRAWDMRADKDAFHYVETRFWNQDAAAFFSLGEERAKVLIDPVLEELNIDPRNATAVDIGCGVGRFTQALARRFAHVTGCDVSDRMIAQAKSVAAKNANIQFVAGDGVRLPVDSNYADFVWSYEVFQHMPSHDIVKANLSELARILSPKGYALIQFRTAHEYPTILWHLARLVPTSVIRATKVALKKDPMTADSSWRGAKPIDKATIQSFCNSCGLNVVGFRADPTHRAGTRVFAILQR